MKQVVVLADAAEDIEAARDFYDAHEAGVGEYCVDSLLTDIESLGLHGSGVMAFLVGVGIQRAETLDCEQYLLVDPDGEGAMLAAILTFSDRVIYPSYESVSRPWSFSALEDQSIAGVIMWVPGSVAFLLPLLWLVLTVLAGPKVRPDTVEAAGGQPALRSR